MSEKKKTTPKRKVSFQVDKEFYEMFEDTVKKQLGLKPSEDLARGDMADAFRRAMAQYISRSKVGNVEITRTGLNLERLYKAFRAEKYQLTLKRVTKVIKLTLNVKDKRTIRSYFQEMEDRGWVKFTGMSVFHMDAMYENRTLLDEEEKPDDLVIALRKNKSDKED